MEASLRPLSSHLLWRVVPLVLVLVAGPTWAQIEEIEIPSLGADSIDPTEHSGNLSLGPVLAQDRQACFNTSRVHTWKVLDRSNIIVYSPGRYAPYHVALGGFCHDLERNFNFALGFVAQGSRICSGTGAELIVGESRCRVKAVTAIDPATADELLAQFEIRRQLKGKPIRR